jgi:Flp pilus assembly protein TadG
MMRRSPLPPVCSQRGVVMALLAIAMVALLLTVGLALDVGHATLNKTRLQDATDAAALAAAKILDENRSTTLATTEALTAFAANANASGDQELAKAYANGAGTVKVTVQYSATLPPFSAGSATGPYVRVSATGFARPTWFATLAGIPQITVAATAVAGPSPPVNTACNIVPLLVCGTPNVTNFGYNMDQPVVMKQSAPGSPSEIGPGNFQLLALGGNGANIVRQNLAGGYTSCVNLGNTVTTEPGNETGPTAQGINTRFGDYSGPMGGTQSQYPPDVITTQQAPLLSVGNGGPPYPIVGNITFGYEQYEAQLQAAGPYNYAPPTGVPGRRILVVPVGDCTGTSGGKTTVPVIGLACFFLLQEETQKGNKSYIIGEFEGAAGTGNGGQGTGNCSVGGTPGPNSGPGPYIIQLYHDPSSGDS